MQKVIDYTDDVIASDYNYLEDFGDIFLPSYKIVKNLFLLFNVLTTKQTILLLGVQTGLIHLMDVGRCGHAVGTSINLHKT